MDVKREVLKILEGEKQGLAAMPIAKKLNLKLMEALRILEDLRSAGLIEKKGRTYKIKA